VPQRYAIADVLAVYEGHPLSRDTILERIARQRKLALPISELDLAVDSGESVSDQNHIGGALSTLRLAGRAHVASDDTVLDLGCGLGGPARLIAEVYGCRVHGIDANAARIQDARQLSELVGLSHLVTFELADFLDMPLHTKYSVIWAQNAWIHIDEPGRLGAVAASALRPGGRLAFEDVWLLRVARGSAETRLMNDLCDVWRSEFSPLARWISAFESAGFDIALSEVDTEILLRHYEGITSLADAAPDAYPAHEIVGWRAALALARAGVIGYGRVIGALRRTSPVA
jgi:SAM-dependent methyltransferase